MNIQRVLIAGALALGVAAPAFADGLRPIQSQSIDLGSVAGDAYYTVQPDGFHVVATLSQRGGATPVRVQAVLANGQGVVFSSPRGEGEQPLSVNIVRQNDEVLVRPSAVVN